MHDNAKTKLTTDYCTYFFMMMENVFWICYFVSKSPKKVNISKRVV